jgi:hypothetical protein
VQGDQPPLTSQSRNTNAEHGRRAHRGHQQPAGAQQQRLLSEKRRPSQEALAPSAVNVAPNPRTNRPAAVIVRRGPAGPASPPM